MFLTPLGYGIAGEKGDELAGAKNHFRLLSSHLEDV
jgi:hypothetical protein